VNLNHICNLKVEKGYIQLRYVALFGGNKHKAMLASDFLLFVLSLSNIISHSMHGILLHLFCLLRSVFLIFLVWI
jgi:hypothetical protein